MNTKNNKLTDFYDNVPGSNYRIKDIDSRINGYGDLSEIYDVDVIVNSINKILRINKGTYLDDPNFGVGLEKYLFEHTDKITQDAIIQDVKNAIANYERRAKIHVEVVFFNDMKGFQIQIFVEKDGQKRDTKINITESLIKNL